MRAEEEHWDLQIKPKRGVFDISLAELWNYRFLIVLFVRRDFVAQYKQTVLGPLWHFIQPMFTTAIFLLVFARIANIPTDGIPPILFYITGITLWNYFSTTLVNTSSTFVTNASIFGKVYFPRLVMPLSMSASGLIKFGVQFLLVVVVMIWYQFNGYAIQPSAKWLLLPVLITLMAGIGLGVGIIVSSLTTRYRDFSVLLQFGVQLGMYATPIAYPFSFLKMKSYGWIIAWNPLTPVVEVFRQSLFDLPLNDMGGLWYSVAFMIISLLFGVPLFNKVESTFMDTV